ncbi:MAG: sialate O-acetylesterase [Verrucomicrobiota bacterium]
MTEKFKRTFFAMTLMASLAVIHAADEAQRQVWQFRRPADSWNGNGPLKHGCWTVRDQMLRLVVAGKGATPQMINYDVHQPADVVNVLQLELDPGSARTGRLWFSTALSPGFSLQKMVEFDFTGEPRRHLYALDLKGLATWKDQITGLRFDFLGAKAGDEISVSRIALFAGGKISKPLIYTSYRLGQKPVVREFRLGSLFNSQMVLQRDRLLPVWGHALPGELITLTFAGQKKNATANEMGKWELALEPMPASGEPQTMTITGKAAHEAIILTNIVVGDVWLCGGQSNMGGSAFDNAPPVERRKELLETDYPLFRFVAIPTLQRETPLANDAMEEALTWRSIQSKSLAGVSAVSYYFGQAVHRSQQVPVGLIFEIKAGSQIEQWMDQDALKSVYSQDELMKVCAGNHLAGGLFNGMMAPLPPFPIRGAIWYQGESNAGNESRYLGYYKSLPAMIRSWRKMWCFDLPVLLVQLPAFNGGYPADSWAHLREAQSLTAKQVSNVGLVVSFDEGEAENLHPHNKYFIGSRLGLVARAMVYGERIEDSGPAYAGLEVRGSQLALHFEHVGGGLKARGELNGFEIRGADGKWMPAKAVISGRDGVILSSPGLAQPQAVRYAWKNAPAATLFNDLGLPASPFRTDTPAALLTAGKNGLAK